MSDLIHHLSIPAELRPFAEDTGLLPGERRREFETVRCMIIDDVRPKTPIEWLWILDLAEMSWEILRYRCLKQKILESYRQAAIEALLQRLDGSGIAAHAAQTMLAHTRRNALQWRDDPDAAVEIEARLKQFGFDAVVINAEVHLQARDQLEMFDILMQRAQQRRILLLREIGIRREFAKRAERVSEAVIETRLLRVPKARFKDRHRSAASV
jgi:hypothetical protein